jgi:hypothetical protein
LMKTALLPTGQIGIATIVGGRSTDKRSSDGLAVGARHEP